MEIIMVQGATFFFFGGGGVRGTVRSEENNKGGCVILVVCVTSEFWLLRGTANRQVNLSCESNDGIPKKCLMKQSQKKNILNIPIQDEKKPDIFCTVGNLEYLGILLMNQCATHEGTFQITEAQGIIYLLTYGIEP